MSAADYLLAACWALWLGSVVFFSFVVAPTAFAVLERERAGHLLRALFPHYYALGIVCGLAATLVGLATGAGLRLTIPLTSGVVLTAYARQVLLPALARARTDGDEDRYARVHVLSVRLNMIVLALLLLAGTMIVA